MISAILRPGVVTPTDNVSELTARTNDEGWASLFVEWLKGSRLQPKDALMIFSVGGGNLEKNISPNLVSALQYAKEVGFPWLESSEETVAIPPKWPMPAALYRL